MFSNLNKPTFGASNTASFGFGSTPPTNQPPFGQSQLFGKPASAPSFGSTAPLFGNAPQQGGTNLFAGGSAPTFGNTPQTQGFGNALFSQQSAGGGNGLFGNTSAASFGQQNKTGFGFGASTSGAALFGQQSQNYQPSTSSGVFGSTTGFGGNAQVGTIIKFNPVTGTDTMQKSGITHSINTKHHCITCMKEYESKSLEELRWEDYQSNRKGSQQQPGFGAPPFGGAQAAAAPLFGQTDNKSSFGQTNTFGAATSGFGMTNQQNQQPLFGAANTNTFGAPATTSSFGFGTSTPVFGATNTSKSFGTQPTQNMFGTQTSQPSGFGNTLFTMPNTQNTGYFGKPPTTSFNVQQPGFSFGQQQQTSQPSTSFFQLPKSTSSFGTLGQSTLTNTSGFGQQNIFSQPNQNPFNAFQKPAQSTFGQPLQTGFNVGQTQPQANFFNKTTAANPYQYFNPPNFAAPQQLQITQNPGLSLDSTGQDFRDYVKYVCSPFPHRDFLDGIVVKKAPTYDTTNPAEIKKIMDKITAPVPTDNSSELRIIPKPKYSQEHSRMKMDLFDDLYDKTAILTNDLLRTSRGKRLIIRPQPRKSDQQLLEDYKAIIAENCNNNRTLIKALPKLDDYTQPDFEERMKQKSPLSGSNRKVVVGNTKLNPVILFPRDHESVNEDSFSSSLFSFNRNRSLQSRQVDFDDNSTFESAPTDGEKDSTKAALNVNSPKLNKTLEIGKNSDEEMLTTPSQNILVSSMTQTETEPDLRVLPTVDIDISKETPSSSTKSVRFVDLEGQSPTKSTSQETTNDDEVLDTCGVKLERSDYYTVPELKYLHLFKTENGACMVKGFTIGRYGYGEVCFPDTMDISNLNIDELVHFRFRELTVYPDDSKKPLIGEGLNRHARVTLNHVWPRDRDTKVLIKDPQELDRIGFIERLIYISEHQEATFLEYKHETGAWIFGVDHFSTYLFTDDLYFTADYYCDLRSSHLRQLEAETRLCRGLGGVPSQTVSSTSRESTFYGCAATQSMFKQTPQSILMKSTLFDEESISDEVSSSDVGVISSFTVQSSAAITPKITDVQKRRTTCPRRYTILNKSSRIPYEHSLLVTRNYADIGIFKGRSFKVGWGKGVSFTTLNLRIGNTEDIYPAETNVSNVIFIKIENINANLGKIEEHLNVVLEESTITVNRGIPCSSVNLNYNSLSRHKHIAKNDTKLKRIWDLCLVFWGPNAVTPVEICRLFSEWLEDAAFSSVAREIKVVEQDRKSMAVQNIFKYLTGHQVYAATQIAMNTNMPRLGALLSQISSNYHSHDLMYEQLMMWKETNALKFIDTELIKIYMLLAGECLLEGLNVCDNLAWIQALGVYFWYACPPGVSVIYALNEYQKAFERGYARKPISPYYEGAIVNDVLYNIMLLYASRTSFLNNILNPLTFIDDPLDYQLSWLLLQSFTAIRVGIISEHVANQVHLNFATQLENMGLWKWSIFVTLYVKDDRVKLINILDILTRHLNPERLPENLADEDFLVKKLKIPTAWVHGVLWLKSNLPEKRYDKYRHLVLLNSHVAAHNFAFKHLIPELLIHDESLILHNLLSCLEVSKSRIFDWDYRGGLVLDYINLKELINRNKTSCHGFAAVEAKAALTNLCVRIEKFPTDTLKHSLAAAEFSKYIASLLKILFSEFYKFNRKLAEEILPLINVLNMPLDYKRDQSTLYLQYSAPN